MCCEAHSRTRQALPWQSGSAANTPQLQGGGRGEKAPPGSTAMFTAELRTRLYQYGLLRSVNVAGVSPASRCPPGTVTCGLRWVVAPDAGGQHPHPDWPAHPQPFSCIAQLHPHPAQPTDPSRLQELILITSFSLEQLSFLVPSPSSLLGTLAFSIRCGSAADMGSTIPPFPPINPPSLLPTSSPLPSIHPGEHPALQGTPARSGASAEVPRVPVPCLPPPQVLEGFAGTMASAGVPPHGARAGGCRHSAAQKSIDCARSQRRIYTENKRSKNVPALPA